jgi:hypothetical protein
MNEGNTTMNTPETKTATFRLNFLLENTEGMFAGWCIETGLAASGLTAEQCAKTLFELTCEHISFALENDNSGDIFQSAPDHVMHKFLAVAKQAEPVSAEKLTSDVDKFCHPLFTLHPAIYASASI